MNWFLWINITCYYILNGKHLVTALCTLNMFISWYFWSVSQTCRANLAFICFCLGESDLKCISWDCIHHDNPKLLMSSDHCAAFWNQESVWSGHRDAHAPLSQPTSWHPGDPVYVHTHHPPDSSRHPYPYSPVWTFKWRVWTAPMPCSSSCIMIRGNLKISCILENWFCYCFYEYYFFCFLSQWNYHLMLHVWLPVTFLLW